MKKFKELFEFDLKKVLLLLALASAALLVALVVMLIMTPATESNNNDINIKTSVTDSSLWIETSNGSWTKLVPGQNNSQNITTLTDGKHLLEIGNSNALTVD